MEEIQNFLKILERENPRLSKCIDLRMAHRQEPKYVYGSYVPMQRSYQFSIEFPSQYRDEVYSLSKFCGLELHHEYTQYQEEVTIFSSPEIFY